MGKKISRLSRILEQAAAHHGGEAAVRARFPTGILKAEEVACIPDSRFLAGMTRAIFRAGFVWRVIDNKWPAFEEVFHGFDVETCAHLPPDEVERAAMDERIVRHRGKVLTVPRNAAMMLEVAAEHGSFARFIADWPGEDYVGLLDWFSRHGERLGGTSCQYFLREMGKDGFLLTKDVSRALINAGVVDAAPNGKTARRKVQAAFDAWREESGLRHADISRILALSIG